MMGTFHPFDSRQALAAALAARIQAWSGAQDGPHRLELSGGSTPKELLAALATQAAAARGDWPAPESLRVLPVDDRCVSQDHPQSNFRMFYEALGGHMAVDFLFDETVAINRCVEALRTGAGSQTIPRFTILGMGPDGHTASLFPASADLAMGLDPCAPSFIAAQPTMEPMVPRITMTAPYILASDHLLLHIHGRDKRALMDAAATASPTTYPIAHFLRHPTKTMDVFYAD